MNSHAATYETVFVARQPIFDKYLECWGYKILYRDNATTETARITDQLDATLRVMANLIVCPESSPQNVKMCITFPHESILAGAPFALPAQNTVIEINEGDPTSRPLLDALHELVKNGYHVAIDDYQGRPDREALCSLADWIIIDAWGKNRQTLAETVQKAKRYEVPLMAKRIEDHVGFDTAKNLEFSLFLGYFFKKPKTLSAKKITSSDAARLRLFKIVRDEVPDFTALASAIEADVSISYRLLTFLNSPFFGFNQKITSIKKALMLAGWNQMKNWLRLIILTDLPAPDKAKELGRLAAQRAKFLELLALAKGRKAISENLFLLGLFSLLEAMLDTPMQSIVSHLPIDDEVKAALAGEKNDYTAWLNILECIESFDWKLLSQLSAHLDIDIETLEKEYQESIAWTNGFFNSTR